MYMRACVLSSILKAHFIFPKLSMKYTGQVWSIQLGSSPNIKTVIRGMEFPLYKDKVVVRPGGASQ